MIKSSNRLSFLGFQNHWRWGLYHEITRHLLLGRKAMYDKPKQHIKKQRCYFATKVHQVKAMVFPVVMYGCDMIHIQYDAVKLLHSICQQTWKTQRGHKTRKRQFSFQSQWKAMQKMLKLPHNCIHLTH